MEKDEIKFKHKNSHKPTSKSFFNRLMNLNSKNDKSDFFLDEYYAGKQFKAYSKLFKSFSTDETSEKHANNINFTMVSNLNKGTESCINDVWSKDKQGSRQRQPLEVSKLSSLSKSKETKGKNEGKKARDDSDIDTIHYYNTDYAIFQATNKSLKEKKTRKRSSKLADNFQNSNNLDSVKNSNAETNFPSTSPEDEEVSEGVKVDRLQQLKHDHDITSQDSVEKGAPLSSRNYNKLRFYENKFSSSRNFKKIKSVIYESELSMSEKASQLSIQESKARISKLKKRVLWENERLTDVIFVSSFKKENKKNTYWAGQKGVSCGKCQIL